MPFRIGNRVNFQAWLNNLYRNDIGWFTFAGTPTSGTSGTLAGFAGPGCLLWDTTNKALYVNSGTKASPSWTYSSAAAATKTNFSNTTVSAGYATDTYLAGSAKYVSVAYPAETVVLLKLVLVAAAALEYVHEGEALVPEFTYRALFVVSHNKQPGPANPAKVPDVPLVGVPAKVNQPISFLYKLFNHA